MTESQDTTQPREGKEASPRRIQRKRAKGWRMPPNAVYVGRPTIFGNPWTRAETLACGFFRPEYVAEVNVREFRGWLEREILESEKHARLSERRTKLLAALPTLKGKDLACWCKVGSPCHADVLLELANKLEVPRMPDPQEHPRPADPCEAADPPPAPAPVAAAGVVARPDDHHDDDTHL